MVSRTMYEVTNAVFVYTKEHLHLCFHELVCFSVVLDIHLSLQIILIINNYLP